MVRVHGFREKVPVPEEVKTAAVSFGQGLGEG
jgi:hypothetical protein